MLKDLGLISQTLTTSLGASDGDEQAASADQAEDFSDDNGERGTLQDLGLGLKVINDSVFASLSPAGISAVGSIVVRNETAALIVALNSSSLVSSRVVVPAYRSAVLIREISVRYTIVNLRTIFNQAFNLLGVNNGGNGDS